MAPHFVGNGKKQLVLRAAKISFASARKSILIFALINCSLYIVLALTFKYLNLLHVWGLRMSNYAVLIFVCIWQVRHWVKSRRGYVPFLEAFFTALFTGSLASVLFGAFIFVYSLSDPYLAPMYVADAGLQSLVIPPVMLVVEGAGASIIVALIVMLYASRFEEGEAKI